MTKKNKTREKSVRNDKASTAIYSRHQLKYSLFLEYLTVVCPAHLLSLPFVSVVMVLLPNGTDWHRLNFLARVLFSLSKGKSSFDDFCDRQRKTQRFDVVDQRIVFSAWGQWINDRKKRVCTISNKQNCECQARKDFSKACFKEKRLGIPPCAVCRCCQTKNTS